MNEKRLFGIPIGISLIIFMVYLGSIDVLEYTGDLQHNGTARINITFEANEDIFIYPMDASYALLEFDNPQAIKLVKMYRTWGNGLRELNLSKTCTGSWCGCGWCTKSNTAEFVYAFRKGKQYTIVYDLELDPKADVKWSFLGDLVDPYLIGEKTTDEVFKELTDVKPSEMEFEMYSPSELSKEALTMKFTEDLGSVKDYKVLILKNLSKEVDEYSVREVCVEVIPNGTKDVSASVITVCHDESYVSGSHLEYYDEWVEADSIPYGDAKYKIKANIKPEFYPNCPNNAQMCYAIDAIPVLDTGLEVFEQVKW